MLKGFMWLKILGGNGSGWDVVPWHVFIYFYGTKSEGGR
jgi:hypothetical protein